MFEVEKQALNSNVNYKVILKNKEGCDVNGVIRYDSQRNSFRGTIIK